MRLYGVGWRPRRRGRWAGRLRRESRRIDVGVVPQFEHQQLPELDLVIADARDVLLQHAVDERLAEVAALARAPRPEHVGERVAQRPFEPDADRNAKALLAAMD